MLKKLFATAIAIALVCGGLISEASAQSSKVQVKADTVNVRSGPSTSSRVVSTVSKGAVATVVSREGEWAKLKFSDGKTGYVRRDLLTTANSTATQASNSTSRVASV